MSTLTTRTMNSPTHRNKRRKTSAIPKYSVVAINIEELLADRIDELESMTWMVRPKVYGVIQHVLPFHGHGDNEYSVEWGLRGFLKMESDEVAEYNEVLFDANQLSMVKRPNDSFHNTDDDMYLHLMFNKRDDGKGWKVRTFAPYDCDSCTEFPRGSRPCRRGTPWIQAPMIQLYIDLYIHNEGLTHREKRFQCYKWYTTVVHGVLTVGDRRRLCPCIQAQIHGLFPNEEGEEHVGFVL